MSVLYHKVVPLRVINLSLQIQYGSLLQYADDTYLMFCGSTYHNHMDKVMLIEGLQFYLDGLLIGRRFLLLNNLVCYSLLFNVHPLLSVISSCIEILSLAGKLILPTYYLKDGLLPIFDWISPKYFA